jgi:hypothetical protein
MLVRDAKQDRARPAPYQACAKTGAAVPSEVEGEAMTAGQFAPILTAVRDMLSGLELTDREGDMLVQEVRMRVRQPPADERIAVFPVSQIEKIVRAITNDSMGRVWTSERLAPFLDVAASRVPFLAAALVCASVGNMEGAEYLLQWAGPMTVKKPIRRKAKR